MKIIRIINSYLSVNTYIVEYNDKIFVIDPGNEINEIIKNLNTKKINYILLTHGHMDHFYGVKELIKLHNCDVYLNTNDKEFTTGEKIIDYNFDPKNYCFKFIDYKNFKEDNIEILNTPGHSNGSICIYFKNENIIFSGDTIFKGSFGRVDFPYGNLIEMKKSINNILKLNENTIIYPGHGERTTIKDEKTRNIIKYY